VTDAPTESGSQSAWAMLRRRKVVQWDIAYVAATCGLLQGHEYATTTFHRPERLCSAGKGRVRR